MRGLKPPAMPDQQQVLLTPTQARAILQLGENKLWQLIHSGELPAIQFSEKVWRIRASALDEWAREQEAKCSQAEADHETANGHLRVVAPRKSGRKRAADR